MISHRSVLYSSFRLWKCCHMFAICCITLPLLSSSQRTHCLLYYMFVVRQFIRFKPVPHRQISLSRLQKLVFRKKKNIAHGEFTTRYKSLPWKAKCDSVTHSKCNTRVGTLIAANIYLQMIQNRYMFRSFTVLHCSHQHCLQPVASDVEVVGYL